MFCPTGKKRVKNKQNKNIKPRQLKLCNCHLTCISCCVNGSRTLKQPVVYQTECGLTNISQDKKVASKFDISPKNTEVFFFFFKPLSYNVKCEIRFLRWLPAWSLPHQLTGYNLNGFLVSQYKVNLCFRNLNFKKTKRKKQNKLQ